MIKADKLRFPFILLLLIALLSGCTALTDNKKSNSSEGNGELEQAYFPKDKIINVDITIDEADFQAILDDPTTEQYYSADVDYNGNLLKNIGFRTKGNSSLTSVARMTDSDRYSFKLSLDEYVTQSFDGITKINLNNNFSDASYMREYLAYELANDMGLATPLFSFVNVYINGELWGLYTAVEQMNTSFIERELEDTSGTLYKSNGGTGADLTALDTFAQYTGLDVKYGEADEEALLKFTQTLNNENEYEDVLDVDSALKFIALNTVIVNMDSYAGNFKHNYYLYELNGKFTIIPWDMNMAFGGFGGSGILIDEPTGVALATRPLIAQLIANENYLERYHQIIAELINQHFTNGAFDERVQQLKELISDSVKSDPTAFVTFNEFEAGITSLLSFVKEQTTSFTKQLNGEIPSAGDGSGSASTGPGNGGAGGNNMNFGKGGMTPPDGMNFPNGESAGGGMAPPDGMNFPNGEGAGGGMAPPDGMNFPNGEGVGGGMTPPDGMNFPNREDAGGGRGGNFNPNQDGQFQAPNTINNQTVAITIEEKEKHAKLTLFSIAAILIGCIVLFVWRRKRL